MIRNAGTTIANCPCANTYQDQKYGKGRRAANSTKTGRRCTSCGKDIARQAAPVA